MTKSKTAIRICVVVAFLGLMALAVTGFFRMKSGSGVPFLLFVFVGGLLGASVNFLRDLHHHADSKGVETLSMLSSLFSRLLVGGALAVAVYMLFVSGLLQGSLFPLFEDVDYSTKGSILRVAEPEKYSDFGKCMVWAFLAGYSERFLPGLLTPTK